MLSLSVVMLNVIMLRVIMLNVIMLNVVAPLNASYVYNIGLWCHNNVHQHETK